MDNNFFGLQLPYFGKIYFTDFNGLILFSHDLSENKGGLEDEYIKLKNNNFLSSGREINAYYECEIVEGIYVITDLIRTYNLKKYIFLGSYIKEIPYETTDEEISLWEFKNNMGNCFVCGHKFNKDELVKAYIKVANNKHCLVAMHKEIAKTYYIYDEDRDLYRNFPDGFDLHTGKHYWRSGIGSCLPVNRLLMETMNCITRRFGYDDEDELQEQLDFLISQYGNIDDDYDDEDDYFSYSEDDYDDLDSDYEYKVYPHDYRPKKFKPINLSNENSKYKMSVGLEIEVECKEDTRKYVCKTLAETKEYKDVYYLVHDGSLHNGVELVSQPFVVNYSDGANKIANKLNSTLQLLDKLKTSTSDRCGLHIHIGREYLTKQAIAKLQYMFELFEKELIKFSKRKQLSYTRPIKHFQFKDNIRDIRNCIMPIMYGMYREEDKYVSLNTDHSATLEIRLWKGTQTKEEIEAYIEMTLLLCSIANKKTISEINKMEFSDIINLSNNKSFKKFAKGVM